MTVPNQYQNSESENAVAMKIIEAARSIVNYAVAQLPGIFMDDKGNILWHEGYIYLSQVHRQKYSILYEQLDRLVMMKKAGRLTEERYNELVAKLQIPEISLEDICDTLEYFSGKGKLGFEVLDQAIGTLPVHLKVLVGIGFGAGRTVLRTNSGAFDELRTERDQMVLKLIKHESTRQAYFLLKDRPNLLKFISEYVLMKLNIPPRHSGEVNS